MSVKLLDLNRQHEKIKERLDTAVQKVFEHGLFILGPEVKELEQKVAVYTGSKYGIGVASGTDALLIALRATGIKPGDEVITSNYSFFASASVISRIGARPVFVDIDKETYNIDTAKIEAAISPKTKAIIPVHLFGQVADMDEIMDIAKKNNLTVIEDAAQAIGAKYKEKKAGSIGDFGCFSFYPSKNLGGVGDGGMITTGDDRFDEDSRMFRLHGWKKKYRPIEIGYNSRLDTLQAAILLVKLDYLDEWHVGRQNHARRYDEAFAGTRIITPTAKDHNFHIYNQYTIAVENRDDLLQVLKEKEIGHDIYYPVPFHLLECYKDLDYKKGDFPVSEWASDNVVSIPVYPEMTDEEQDEVIEVVKSVSA